MITCHTWIKALSIIVAIITSQQCYCFTVRTQNMKYVLCCSAHEWASIIGRNDMIQHSPEYVNKNFFLCGHHFDEHMFRNVKKNRLVVDAVPNPKAPVMSVRLVEDGNGSIQTTSIALSTTTSLLTFPVQLFYKSSDCRPTNDACRQPTQDHLEQKQATSDDCNPERVRNWC